MLVVLLAGIAEAVLARQAVSYQNFRAGHGQGHISYGPDGSWSQRFGGPIRSYQYFNRPFYLPRVSSFPVSYDPPLVPTEPPLLYQSPTASNYGPAVTSALLSPQAYPNDRLPPLASDTVGQNYNDPLPTTLPPANLETPQSYPTSGPLEKYEPRVNDYPRNDPPQTINYSNEHSGRTPEGSRIEPSPANFDPAYNSEINKNYPPQSNPNTYLNEGTYNNYNNGQLLPQNSRPYDAPTIPPDTRTYNDRPVNYENRGHHTDYAPNGGPSHFAPRTPTDYPPARDQIDHAPTRPPSDLGPVRGQSTYATPREQTDYGPTRAPTEFGRTRGNSDYGYTREDITEKTRSESLPNYQYSKSYRPPDNTGSSRSHSLSPHGRTNPGPSSLSRTPSEPNRYRNQAQGRNLDSNRSRQNLSEEDKSFESDFKSSELGGQSIESGLPDFGSEEAYFNSQEGYGSFEAGGRGGSTENSGEGKGSYERHGFNSQEDRRNSKYRGQPSSEEERPVEPEAPEPRGGLPRTQARTRVEEKRSRPPGDPLPLASRSKEFRPSPYLGGDSLTFLPIDPPYPLETRNAFQLSLPFAGGYRSSKVPYTVQKFASIPSIVKSVSAT